jgi:hypothetical protein
MCNAPPFAEAAVRPSHSWCSGIATLLLVASAAAATGQGMLDGVELETVLERLANPSGLAVRPGGSRSGPDLFIAETGGGRVQGLSTETEAEPIEVLAGFTQDGGAGPGCMVFRSRNRLLVGQSATANRPAMVSEYDVDDERLPMASSERKAQVDYAPDDGPVEFADMTRNEDQLFIATAGHQWLLESKLVGSLPGEVQRFKKPIVATRVGTPRAVVVSEKGYLLAAESGPSGSTGNALIVFHHPVDITPAPLLVLETGLDEIQALVYSPITGNLYAAAISLANPEQSGVYRIDAVRENGRDGCKVVLVARVERAMAMVFADNGALYVVTAGEADGATGKLLKLTGEL